MKAKPMYLTRFYVDDLSFDPFHQIKTSAPLQIEVGHMVFGEISMAYNRNLSPELAGSDRLIVKQICHWIPDSAEIQDDQEISVILSVVRES